MHGRTQGTKRIYACDSLNLREGLCHVHIGNGILDFCNSTIGVNQGCSLSPTLFGLCIDKLEQMVVKLV